MVTSTTDQNHLVIHTGTINHNTGLPWCNHNGQQQRPPWTTTTMDHHHHDAKTTMTNDDGWQQTTNEDKWGMMTTTTINQWTMNDRWPWWTMNNQPPHKTILSHCSHPLWSLQSVCFHLPCCFPHPCLPYSHPLFHPGHACFISPSSVFTVLTPPLVGACFCPPSSTFTVLTHLCLLTSSESVLLSSLIHVHCTHTPCLLLLAWWWSSKQKCETILAMFPQATVPSSKSDFELADEMRTY